MKFIIIFGIILIVIFIFSFKENSKYESTEEAAKSGLWSAGGCLIFVLFCLFAIAQCSEIFNSDSSTNRKLRDIPSGNYDPYDDAF